MFVLFYYGAKCLSYYQMTLALFYFLIDIIIGNIACLKIELFSEINDPLYDLLMNL